jgi:O-acetylhomoserine (thiol)-lyase
LQLTLPRVGIETSFVDPRDPKAFADAIKPETRLVFAETLGNPGLEVLNIPKIAEVAHEAGLPLLVDNTFASPFLSNPIKQGADIVMHSATKWLGGHGIAIGGILVDGGRFDWEASGKFPTLTEPYAGYGGLDYVDAYGPGAFHMRARTEGLRDFGACLSPQNAFYILQGVETLPLRMARHVSTTDAVVRYLSEHDAVAYVIHPSLESHPDHQLAKELLPKGQGSIVSFGVKGGRDAGRRFIEGCSLASHLANVGDAKTLVIHPASTTHLQVDAEHLKEAGVGEDMIRLSVGLEDPDDIIDDLKGALRASQRG